MTTWMDGRALAAELEQGLRERVGHLANAGITPTLAIVVVGDDERTASYIRAKQATAERIGIAVKVYEYSAAAPETLEGQLLTQIDALNTDTAVHGIILQLPVPRGVDDERLLNAISPTKDVDGLTATNQASVEMGRELFPPATPMGILRLLGRYGIPIEGTVMAVLGQGRVVGKPLADMLESRGAIVRRADHTTADLGAVTHGASVVISATGQPGLVTASLIDPDIVLIDAGLAEVGTSLVGDTSDDAQAKARLATPAKGGVGPMTVVSLLGNVVVAAELAQLRT